MCTISETKVTTTIISTVSRSMRTPLSLFKTCMKTKTEQTNETSTARIVTRCAPARPITRPKRPATIAPNSGASGMIRYRVFIPVVLPFEGIQVFDVDRIQVPEKNDQDGETDRRLGRRHRQDEEHEHLSGGIAEETGEGDEVQVHGEQHQLDRHQQHDDVAPVQEDADHADREQDRAQHKVMVERQRIEAG